MSSLRLEDLGKSFGNFAAVSEVNLEFPHGKFICLLGPSGCGKTTLLRLIAGLEQPTTGHIKLDGKDLTAVPAHQREFGMVFQSLALFPHLTVGENISYGLSIRGTGKPGCRQRAQELLELVRLPGVIDRHISQLSGGQRRRKSRLPVRSRSTPSSSCSMSRFPPWTPSLERQCRSSCGSSSSVSASRPSW